MTLVIVGVRFQDFPAFAQEVGHAEIIISMMAGIPCRALREAFPEARIIRMIPNTPCALGAGLTPIYVAP